MDEQVEPAGGAATGPGASLVEGATPIGSDPRTTTRRPMVAVLLVVVVVAGGVLGWRALTDRPTIERHRDPITAVRVTEDGRYLAITALPDGCFPDGGQPHAEVDGDRLVLSVVQTKEVDPGEAKFCTLACAIGPGAGGQHTLEIEPAWAGLTMVAAPDDGHCSLDVGPGGPQRAPYLGTVPAVPDQ